MIKKLLTSIIVSLVILFVFKGSALAVSDPLAVPNNKFGIHILDVSDLEDAAKLVNSTGGDYGYITFVIREDERDVKKWQEFFDKARKLHLIPIVRIASKMGDGYWHKLSKDEIPGWVTFLNELNWITENRYVIIGNEPNHAKEWQGTINPEEYTDYLAEISDRLKAVSGDFYILPAGLDASAPDNGEHMSEERYLRRMYTHNKEVFNKIDGWSSHSYPNPGFSGSEKAKGRGTLHTYDWEIELLQDMGINRKLPIFITETGWAHDRENEKLKYLSPDEIALKYKSAFENNFSNPNIVAVTPFVLNYINPPFDMFSWKKPTGEFYSFYYTVRDLPKKAGAPIQKDSSEIISFLSPPIIKKDTKVLGLVFLKNTGQKIWHGNDTFTINISGKEMKIEPVTIFENVEPGEKTLALYEIPQ